MKTVYLYDENGLYTGIYDAHESPLQPGVYIQPTQSTDIAPEFTAGTWPVFDEVWSNVQDNRGVVWNTSTGEETVHGEIGPLPVGLTSTPKPAGFYHWVDGGWVFDFAAAKAAKQAEMRAATGAAIVAGITCNALGDAHSYPTTRDDQANLNGLITETLLPGSGDSYKFWCADSVGVWQRRTHTKLQIQSVGVAVAAHVKEQKQKYEGKLADIAALNSSASQAQFDAINW